MPIATGVAAPEFPTSMVRQQSLGDCLSPGVTPKAYVPPPFTANDPSTSIPQWCPSFEGMPQFVQQPGNMYGCPPGAVMIVPFPYMFDQNGQMVQYPCPMNHTQPQSWPEETNKFHMPCVHESDASQEEIHSAAPSKDDSKEPAEIDTPRVMPADAEDDAEHAVPTLPDDVIALGNPRQMLADADLASHVVTLLESSSHAKRAAIVAWMQPVVMDLALSANGTRIIQKALEVTGGETQIMLSLCMHGCVRKLLDSHHGNHVLQKSIVMMPPHAVQFIFHELSFYRQGWAGVVCHRFGCRVVERLLEHCDAALTAPIVAAVVADIDSLSRHPFANYVVQHILEYVPAHRAQVVHALVQVGVPLMAQHRVASNIVERAFEHSGTELQQALAEAILASPGAIVDMSCGRYGSFTVRRMLEALQGTLRYMALQQLGEAIPQLQASKSGRPIASRVLRALSKIDGAYA